MAYLKKLIKIIIFSLIIWSFVPAYPSNAQSEVSLYIDDVKQEVNGIVIDGRTLVPLRVIFEALGVSVEWDSKTKTVTSQKNDINLVLTIDNKTAEKNGQTIELDVPPQIVNGSTMVPVRLVSETFGADVKWDSSKNRVDVYSSNIAVEENKAVRSIEVNYNGKIIPQFTTEFFTINDHIYPYDDGPDYGLSIGFNYTIEKDKLPEELKDFKYIAVTGSSEQWTEADIINQFNDAKVFGRSIMKYDYSTSYASGNSLDTSYNIMILYDENVNPLGFYLFDESRVIIERDRFEIEHLGRINYQNIVIPEFTEGISLNKASEEMYENPEDYKNVTVDRELLPDELSNFTKIQISQSNVPWTEERIIKTINESINVVEYDDEYGIVMRINIGYSFNLIIFYDSNNKPLGFYLFK